MDLNWIFAFLIALVIVLSPAVALYLATGQLIFGLLGIVIGLVLLVAIPTLSARLTVAIGGRADAKDAEHDRIRKKLEEPGDQFAGPFARNQNDDEAV